MSTSSAFNNWTHALDYIVKLTWPVVIALVGFVMVTLREHERAIIEIRAENITKQQRDEYIRQINIHTVLLEAHSAQLNLIRDELRGIRESIQRRP